MNFTREATAKLFGVHEVCLSGKDTGRNNFDIACTVTFVPPSGSKDEICVKAFHDGRNTWKARVYTNQTGTWHWYSRAEETTGLDAWQGSFEVEKSGLKGMLRPHPYNPRHWAYDDGDWFLCLSDTAYLLFNRDEAYWKEYVRDAGALGINLLRCSALGGVTWGMDSRWSNHPWCDEDSDIPALEKFREMDHRLIWLLDTHPGIYLQLILFGTREWGKDNTGSEWNRLPAENRTRMLDYMLARWAAFPQVIWQVANDLHCSEEFPENRRFVIEIGRYLSGNDPWKHLLSTGANRKAGFPFLNGEDGSWATYIHLEEHLSLAADESIPYQPVSMHVLMGEDRYEQDRLRFAIRHPDYFYRRIFWAWALSEGSGNYGGRWSALHPYSMSGQLPYRAVFDEHTYTNKLTGLDSVKYLRDFLHMNGIELWKFRPMDSWAEDLAGRGGIQRPKLMYMDENAILVYHPNASCEGVDTEIDQSRRAGVRLNLRDLDPVGGSAYSVLWYCPADGRAEAGAPVAGGAWVELTAPWQGTDVVLYIKKQIF